MRKVKNVGLFWLLQEREPSEEERRRHGLLFVERRMNPWNPLTYLFLAVAVPLTFIFLVLVPSYGYSVKLKNMFKWVKQ